MNNHEFKKYGYELVDWMAEYFENIEKIPVKPNLAPGDIINQLPIRAPVESESFDKIFADFKKIILPGMTHWQHPSFFAYFPGNSSKYSLLGEMITATLGAQCMSWLTSPAATELEELTLKWLRNMLGLPTSFSGVIQDTASTATLCAILTARERFSNGSINKQGFVSNDLTVYASEQAHSSIEKNVRIAGIGSNNLRKVSVDENYAMVPAVLEELIKKDISAGKKPLCIIASLGTTNSTAIDPIAEIGKIKEKYNVWLHVDAAFAGTALILPEYRWMSKGVEKTDSFVVNPHKWMFTNFDCCAYFIKDPEMLIKTFAITPEYLKTREDEKVNNYRDWGIQLGRRFRALKLWFVIRGFGIKELREKIRFHIQLGQWFAERIRQSPDFDLMAPVPLNLVCFRYHPQAVEDRDKLNSINKILLAQINDSGEALMTHTQLNGNFVIRLVAGQTEVDEIHLEKVWELINHNARSIKI